MAGERWVASKGLCDKEERREEDDWWAERPSEVAIVGLAGVFEGLLCGKREDSSVGDSSTVSSSSTGVDLFAGPSEKVKPL